MGKVIFLDIDGVLTSDAYTRQCLLEHRRKNSYGMDWFDPVCVAALGLIVDSTGAGIVISSSWRKLGEEKLKSLWEEQRLPGSLIGTTPIWVLTKREAIARWLEDNACDGHIVIDDADLDTAHHYKPNRETGLSMQDAEKIIAELQN